MDCKKNVEDVRKDFHRRTTTQKHRLVRVCEYGTPTMCTLPQFGCHAEEKSTYRMDVATIGQEDWTLVAYVCLGDESEVTDAVSETEIRQAFQELTWPEATLQIQPPDGETLVNLPTIFHTTDTQPQTQTVVLLGTTIEIEATPTSWTWHWAQPDGSTTGDDTQHRTTTTPGAPHPNETITHTYSHAGTVRPSVDVTYTGRYRIDDGDWTDIEEPHTVTGTPQPLDILEARPVLIH